MVGREEVEATLKALGIAYEIQDHPAAYTVEDMVRLGVSQRGRSCKNLFLRDSKGINHFLVVVPEEKPVDLKALQTQLESSRLSFASPERLMKYLGLIPGAVTPLGILNDVDLAVTVVLDQALVGQSRLGVHPNVNTATIWISYDDLVKVIARHGNEIRVVEVP